MTRIVREASGNTGQRCAGMLYNLGILHQKAEERVKAMCLPMQAAILNNNPKTMSKPKFTLDRNQVQLMQTTCHACQHSTSILLGPHITISLCMNGYAS